MCASETDSLVCFLLARPTTTATSEFVYASPSATLPPLNSCESVRVSVCVCVLLNQLLRTRFPFSTLRFILVRRQRTTRKSVSVVRSSVLSLFFHLFLYYFDVRIRLSNNN